ncbi:MAG: six-cysteine ranthipeptide SCIFF [Clostridia bacterium]|nr:six-cysteine ranthipeptide SCIFF [Clostridia bacterium]
MKHIKIIVEGNLNKRETRDTGCGECRSSCQSACKTSCTVGNQSCERNPRNPVKKDCEQSQ